MTDVEEKYRTYYDKRDIYDRALGEFNNPVVFPKTDEEKKALAESKAALAEKKTAYEAALKAFRQALTTATEDSVIKDTEGYEELLGAIDTDEKKREAYDAALSELAKFKDDISKIDDAKKTEIEGAFVTAKTALQTATTNYKNALAKVKTAVEDYTTATKDLVPVFRVFHPGTLEHLYTVGANERDELVKIGWKDENVAWLTVGKDAKDAAPVYRLCYPGTGDHHYTTDKNERDTLIKTQGWKDETVAFYVPKKGDASVYRVYLSSLKVGAHHFTTGRNEYDTLVQNGWRPEGVSFEVSAKDWIDVKDIKTADERIKKVENLWA